MYRYGSVKFWQPKLLQKAVMAIHAKSLSSRTFAVVLLSSFLFKVVILLYGKSGKK